MPGVRIFRNNSGVDTTRGIRYGLGVGSADLIGLVDGKFVALEVKSSTGKLSNEQACWIRAIELLGGFARVVRSVDEALRAVADVRST